MSKHTRAYKNLCLPLLSAARSLFSHVTRQHSLCKTTTPGRSAGDSKARQDWADVTMLELLRVTACSDWSKLYMILSCPLDGWRCRGTNDDLTEIDCLPGLLFIHIHEEDAYEAPIVTLRPLSSLVQDLGAIVYFRWMSFQQVIDSGILYWLSLPAVTIFGTYIIHV